MFNIWFCCLLATYLFGLVGVGLGTSKHIPGWVAGVFMCVAIATGLAAIIIPLVGF